MASTVYETDNCLASHQCGPGLPPSRCYMWVSILLVLPLFRGFSPGSPVFLPAKRSKKPTFPNSDSTKIEDSHENQLRLPLKITD